MVTGFGHVTTSFFETVGKSLLFYAEPLGGTALLIENFSLHRLDASNDVPVHCLGNHQQGAVVEEHHHQPDAPRRNSIA
jgi:hypothetical protein